jgi:small subunit ribosomal protein S20
LLHKTAVFVWRTQTFVLLSFGSHASVKNKNTDRHLIRRIWILANIQSAKKRIRQTVKRTENNRRYKTAARTHVKRARQLLDSGDLAAAEVAVQTACSVLDKAARKNVLHAGNASRRKGRLMAALAAAKTAAAE